MVQHILFLTENEYFYLCIIYSLLTMMYTFKQEIQLAKKNLRTPYSIRKYITVLGVQVYSSSSVQCSALCRLL